MKLIAEDTKIIFVMTSIGSLLDRFADDFKYACLDSLNQIGFPKQNITVISDTTTDELQKRYGLPTDIQYEDSSNMLKYIETIDCENLIIVSSCHGSMHGFESKTKIKPFPFATALNNNAKAKNILVMFGQCFSGIYNYSPIDCSKKTIVLMGAAGMNESASVDGLAYNGKPINWKANIAVWAFFNWLCAPIDVDGDAKNTAMDLYKQVSSHVLKVNDILEHSSYAEWIKKRGEVEKKIEATDKADTAAINALNKELHDNNFNYLLPRQLPWIQNPNGALAMTIEL